MAKKQSATRNRSVQRSDPHTAGQPAMDALLRDIAAGVSANVGEDFFHSLVLYLSKTLNVDLAFVGELTGEDRQTIDTISVCLHGAVVDNMRYELARTPCEHVIKEGLRVYSRNVQQLFPKDKPAADMGMESYAGAPLRSSSGEVIGLIAVMDIKPLSDPKMAQWLLQIFASRAEAELERRQGEQTLHESEQKLRLFVQNSPDVILSLKRDGTILFINHTIPPYSADQVIGTNVDQYILPTDVAPYKRALTEVFDHGAPQTLEIGAVESTRWLSRLVPIKDGERIQSVMVIATDITERRKAEQERGRLTEQIGQQARLLDTILSTTPDHFYVFNREGRYLYASIAGAQVLGRRPEEMIGKTWRELEMPAEIMQPFDEQRLRVLASGKPVTGELDYPTVDGLRSYEYTISPIPTERDGIGAVMVTVRDITERKAAGERLRQSEERFRRLSEVAVEGIAIHDRGKILDANETMARLFGCELSEFIGRNALEFTAPESREVLKKNMLSGVEEPYEAIGLRRDGTTFVGEIVGRPIIYEGKPARVVAIRDVTERKQVEHVVARLGRILDDSSNEIYVFDAEMLHFIQVNRGAQRNLGYDMGELRRLTPLDLKPAYTKESFEELIGPLRRGEQDMITFETVHRRKDGSLYPVEVRLQLSRAETPPVFVAIIQDITARKASEEETRKLSSAIQHTADAVVITDRDGIMEYVNQAFEEITGYTREEALGRKTSIVKSGKHDNKFYQRLWSTILAGENFRDIFINRKKNGDLYYEEKTITPLKDLGGNVTHFIATGKDITERMQTQEQLHHLAYHDVLTDLPNRALLVERIEHALARAHWTQRPLALLFLDLDRFKLINDTLGHDIGDRLLQLLAQRLVRCVREGDTVARLSGDEFAILLEDIDTANDVVPIARKTLDAFTQAFEVFNHELFITTSIGISVYPGDGKDVPTLLRNADTAMYRAKDRGKNNYQFYSADMSAKAVERLTLETGLRRALERKEFVLYYQPQVDLATGRIVGAEALIRWEHQELGLVQPADFIPLLEETGMIVQVGEWVMESACAQAKQWCALKNKPIRITVNLSARQFSDPGLLQKIARVLGQCQARPELIELEITESIIMENAPSTVDTLNKLNGMGFRFAIDDFGTGYSSLSYLKRFAINTLKVDRSFVRDIPGDPDDASIVSTIVAMAHNLKLEVIAEGVETDEQLAFLRACGCDGYQGYLFSRPVPAEEFTRLLRRKQSQA